VAASSQTKTDISEQEALSVILSTHLAYSWHLLDPRNVKGTFGQWLTAVAATIFQYARSSAALAARYYSAERVAAGLPRLTPRLASPPTAGQVETVMRWATKGLWQAQPDLVAVRTVVNGAAQKLAVDTGRNTLIEAIQADRRARGWAREAKPTACSFCAMLSIRGAVYRSKQTAEFLAHDHCHCIPVPLFADAYEPPAYVRAWQQQWDSSTAGLSGNAARIAFRQTLEGRSHAEGT